MAGLNQTGRANPDDYNLGRGKVYFREPGEDGVAWRDLGNATEFNITAETETLEHQSSLEGLQQVDLEVTLSQKTSVSLVLDEINFDNVAIFLAGSKSVQNITANATRLLRELDGINGADGDYDMDLTDPSLGRWYDLETADDYVLAATPPVTIGKVRFYDLDNPTKGLTPNRVRYGTGNDEEQVSVFLNPSGANTQLTRGTDFEVDWVMGRIFFIPGGGVPITPGTVVRVTIYTHEGNDGAAGPKPAGLDIVNALTQGSFKGGLKFVSENPTNADHQTEFTFEAVNLRADGDFSLIGDEWTVLNLSGTAEKGTNGKTLTVVTHKGSSQPSYSA